VANVLLAFPDKAALGTVSGGSFYSTLPVSNILTSVITQVARTTDLTPTSTQFVLDAGRVQGASVIGLLNHNMSLPARVRVTASLTADFGTASYDSGWCAVWSGLFATSDLEWEDDSWWAGTIDADAIGSMRPAFVLPTGSDVFGRYWKVEIDDATNSAGYVQIGRLFLAKSWTPARNPAYGWGIQWVSDSAVETSLGGTKYFSPRSSARKSRISLGWMTKAEAYSKALEIQRQLGDFGELLVVADQDDASTLQQRSFLARISGSDEVRHIRANVYSVEFELSEVV